MLKKYTISLITLLAILIIPKLVLAASPTTINFLTFTDQTPYKSIKTNIILAKLLGERLLNSGDYVIKLSKNSPEVINLKKKILTTEFDLNASDVKKSSEAASTSDFSYFLNEGRDSAENSKILLLNSKVNDCIYPEEFGRLGNLCQAEYFVHGDVIYLGAGKKKDIFPLLGVYISDESAFLVAVADIRIIRSKDGKVVWGKRIKGVADETLTGISNLEHTLKFGSNKLHAGLFEKALEKLADNAVKDLSKTKSAKKETSVK